MISQEAHPDATIIWGATFDNSLEDTIKVTVIATGFRAEDANKPAAAANTLGRNTKPSSGFNFAKSAPVAPAKPEAPAHTIAKADDSSSISEDYLKDILDILQKNRG